MGEDHKLKELSLEKPKLFVPRICLEGEQKTPMEAVSYSVPSSPRGSLMKQSGKEKNCLCSPTTHPGSFRCRYHRNQKPGLTRNSMSVGSKLSDLARKPSESVMCSP